MVDYRFVHEDPPNLLVAARLVNADSAVIDWTAWMLIKQNTYPGFPTYVPIPAPGELPDSVRQWLDTTDCCQVSAPRVQSGGRGRDSAASEARPRRAGLCGWDDAEGPSVAVTDEFGQVAGVHDRGRQAAARRHPLAHHVEAR